MEFPEIIKAPEFPDIQAMAKRKIAAIAYDPDDRALISRVPDTFEDTLTKVKERFESLGNTGMRYFLVKLDKIATALVEYIKQNKVCDPDVIASSLLSCVNKKVSLLEKDEIHVKDIVRWYQTSSHTSQERLSRETLKELGEKPSLIAENDKFALMQLHDRNDLTTEKHVLGHHINVYEVKKAISEGDTKLFAIKRKITKENETRMRSLWTIVYDVPTKTITQIRGPKNALLNAQRTNFEETIDMLMHLIQHVDAQKVNDMQTVQSTLSPHYAITTEGWKEVSTLTIDDNVLVTGKISLTETEFMNDDFLNILCSLENVQIDFSHLTAEQKNQMMQLKGILIDESQGEAITYNALETAGSIRIPHVNENASFPELHTVANDIITGNLDTLDLPSLTQVGSISSGAKHFKAKKLKDINGEVSLHEDAIISVPAAIKGKIVRR